MRLSFVTENTVDVASDVNQSLLEADGLIVSRVTGIEIAPPAVLVDGQRVAIASGATGAFSGKAGQLGVYVENGAFWQFYSPALCVFDGVTYLSAGGDWIQSSGGAAGEEFTLAEKQKLSGIADEATKNRADSENADKLHTHTVDQVTGLGTAATMDVGTVSGQLLAVGSNGYGTTSSIAITDWNEATKNGVYYNAYNGLNAPIAGDLLGRCQSYSASNCTQTVETFDNGASPRTFKRHLKSNVWGAWVEIHHTGNLLQTTGTSTDFPMSQKAVTDQLATLGTAATANLTTSNIDGTAGRVLKVGDGGWMGSGVTQYTPFGYPSSSADVTNQTKVIRTEVADEGVIAFAAGIHFAAINTWGRLRVRHNTPRAWIQGGSADDGTGWTAELYHTGNTTTDPDGTLKASSPVINLYTDKHDLHNEGQFGATPAVVRKSKGVYEITGTLGLRSEGWYLDTPSDRNGNKYFNIEWTQNITPDAVDGVVDEYRDDIVVTIKTFERVWNKDTGLFENGAPMDINDLQDRFVQLRFNELKIEHEELDDEAITRNQE